MPNFEFPVRYSFPPVFQSELHILRNQTGPELDELITFSYLSSTNLVVTFTAAQLRAGNTSSSTAFPTDFEKIEFVPLINTAQLLANGIVVDINTGSVSFQVPTASPLTISNFIIEVRCYKNINTLVMSRSLRVFVHTSVTKVWLTPDNIDLITFSSRPRFHVYAHFSSGVTANVSNQPYITWAHGWNSTSNPTPPDNGISFSPDGNIAISSTEQASMVQGLANIGIIAQLPSYLGFIPSSQSYTTNTLRIKSKADFINTHRAKLMRASVGSKISPDIEKHPNVLFIAEGFKSSEADKFSQIVEHISNSFIAPKNNDIFPWNKFGKKFNYWSLFVPSVDSEIGHLYKMLPVIESKIIMIDTPPVLTPKLISLNSFMSIVNNYAKNGKGVELVDYYDTITSGLIQSNPNTPPAYLLDDLIEIVGYPTNLDNGKSIATKSAEWTAQFSQFSSNRLNSIIFDGWKKLSSLTVVDQQNTFLGAAHGRISSDARLRSNNETIVDLKGSDTDSLASLGRQGRGDRTNKYALNDLLKGILTESNDNIGVRWSTND